MEPDAMNPAPGQTVAPVRTVVAPPAPGRTALRPSAPSANGNGPTVTCTEVAPVSAPEDRAPVHGKATTDAPSGRPGMTRRALPGATLMHRVTGAFAHRARDTRPDGAPVHEPGHRRDAPAERTGVPVVHTAPPRKKAVRPAANQTVTLGQQWGKLTAERSAGTVWALRVIATLIVVALVGVVVAPPALSAQDIIEWAKSESTDSGLGLSAGWAILTFIALDFAAGVCVLICVYCAIVNAKPGVFALYVWAFAGATAYANWSFGTRPGAPGDADWFFPTMSIVGPLLLHSVLIFLRNRIKGAQGNKRGERPRFPLADWLPIIGTPQDTYGAWRTGAMLGIEVPDAALWAYRAVSLDTGWFGRWFVKGMVRAEQVRAFRARLEDPNLALAIPGLLPEGAFAALVHTDDTAPDDLTGATGAVHRQASATAPPRYHDAPAGTPDSPDVAPGRRPDPVAPGRPGATGLAPVGAPNPGTDAPAGADKENGPDTASVVSLDAAARHSAETALRRIFDRYAVSQDWSSWDELIANTSLNRIERELGIGKRRTRNAFTHAQDVLPWHVARAGSTHQEAQ